MGTIDSGPHSFKPWSSDEKAPELATSLRTFTVRQWKNASDPLQQECQTTEIGKIVAEKRCQVLGTDKAWLYYYDPTIKQHSSEWKHPSSLTLKKAKTVKSAGKVMTMSVL
ncbi:hypothetical protein TNCV_1977701 [Trichonephila clavipes]|nr:hypothetical protein TNCV_1977701 [Trichonephila clavipes]